MSASLKHYLKTVENTLKAGQATEHTHRPALKTLLESLELDVTAINEPKRIACGAPDYIITRNQLTIGYIEAKDVGKSLRETERTDQLRRYRRALDNLIGKMISPNVCIVPLIFAQYFIQAMWLNYRGQK